MCDNNQMRMHPGHGGMGMHHGHGGMGMHPGHGGMGMHHGQCSCGCHGSFNRHLKTKQEQMRIYEEYNTLIMDLLEKYGYLIKKREDTTNIIV